MNLLENIKIQRMNLYLQLGCAILTIAAYFTSRGLVLVASFVSMLYLLSNVKWEQKFSMFMFLLLFSPVLKYTGIDTSMFMFLRVAVVFSYFFQNKKEINVKFIFLCLLFFAYCVTVSEVYNTDYIVKAINLLLWILIGYIIVNTISPVNSSPVIRGLSNGVILTGVIGLFHEEIPRLYIDINVVSSLAEDGAALTRNAGFFGDPNFFTVLIIASLWFCYYEFNNKKMNVTEFFVRSSIASFVAVMTFSKSCALLLLMFWLYVFIAKNDIKFSSKMGLFFCMLIASIVFFQKNPYWLQDITYRFSAYDEKMSLDSITTGRFSLWKMYVESFINEHTWIFGKGLGQSNLNERASHNTILQLIYNIGIVGAVMYFMIFKAIYTSSKETSKIEKQISKKNIYVVGAIVSILLAFLFLDGIFIENFYYMLPLSMIYLQGDILEEKTKL